MTNTAVSIKDIMQFCRLCLVKEQVNVSIFEEHGDGREVLEKIAACLPVTVSKEDKLPKKICDGCLYKLELLYQFRTTCVSAEKQLQVWIDELNNSESKDDEVLKLQHSQTSVKQEDVSDALDQHDSSDFLIEHQITYEGDIPYNESQDDNNGVGDDDATNSSDDEPLAKRRKRILEEQEQQKAEASKIAISAAVTKLENESDDENVDDPEPNFVSVGTTDDQQPGPSGLNKTTTKAANAEMPNSTRIKERKGLESNRCKLCRKIFTSSGWISHKSLCERQDKEFQPRRCDFCNKLYATRSSFLNHKYKCALYRRNKMCQNFNQPRSCIRCKKTYANDDTFSKHLKICQAKLSCEICQEDFEFIHEKDAHLEEVHNIKKNYFPCDLCDRVYKHKYELDGHQKKHTNQYDFICDLCGKGYHMKASLDHHIARIHEGVRYKCKVCKKSFASEYYLNVHSVKHNKKYEQNKFLCSECGHTLSCKASLRHHIEIVHHNVSHVCEICGKAVTSKTSLRNHMRIHAGEKPFKCELCGKSFVKKDSLRIHVRIHTKEKPYVCKLCSKAFSQRSTLTVHMRQHTGEKPYGCVICDKKFYTRTLLKTHSKTHGVELNNSSKNV